MQGSLPPEDNRGLMVATQAVTQQGQLPVETNEFVGRAAELRQIDELLRGARLVTLVGPGGVGKTRVTLRAAAAAAPRYPDGACLVELSALRDPQLLSHTIARQLKLAEQAQAGQLDALLAHLGKRRLLLVLDTCEHLIDACAELAEAILLAAPHVTVLATSREPLGVTGETTVTIPPLPVGAAVELFTRRAGAATGGFAVTDANSGDVIRLCRRLDGIPLTIELAAGRLRELSLTELSQRLDHRLTLLTGGSDRDGGRHATARNAVSWGYETCTATERTLWARLSVFPGSFDIEAAQEVCASRELGRAEIAETVIRLVDKSVLIPADPAAGGGDEPPRFRMLDTIREYGGERLAAAGGTDAVRDQLIARYLAITRHFDEHLFGDEQLALFRQLRREHANLRAALEYALASEPGQREHGQLEHGQLEHGQLARQRDGAELATRLYGYWLSAGLMGEGLYWLGRVLDRFTEPSAQRAWALLISCYIGTLGGDAPRAAALGTEGVSLAAGLKERQAEARGWAFLCLAHTFCGNPVEGLAAGKKAHRLLTALGDTVGLIILATHQCYAYQGLGDLDKAIACYHRALALFEASAERWYHGYIYIMVSLAYFMYPGKDDECAHVLKLALLAKYELEEVLGTAYSLEILGWLAARAARPERAAWLMGSTEPLWSRLGARLGNSPVFEQLHEQAESAARSALGDERYDALVSAGARHPLEQVVALAINDAGSLDDRVPGAAHPGAGTLTDREQEIAYLAAAGLSTEQIARHLFMSEPAVAEHLSCVFGKLGASSADQLGPWLGTAAGPPAPVQRRDAVT
jgi:predicted ATPase/DNA-binding CsgD family transcriptional regulator